MGKTDCRLSDDTLLQRKNRPYWAVFANSAKLLAFSLFF